MIDYDPTSERFRADPYAAYRRLRAEAPVHFSEQAGVWCVSRYDDVMRVLKDDRAFSSRAMVTMMMNNGSDELPPLSWRLARFMLKLIVRARMSPLGFATARNLIAEDGERHSALRNVVNRGFTPRRIASWEPRIAEIVEGCMAELRARPRCDLVEQIAVPVPVIVISELVGAEVERRDDFKRWSDVLIYNATGPGRDDPFNDEMTSAMLEFLIYVKRLARERRANPRDDLISAIVAEQAGEVALDVREVFQFVLLLLVAGNETTTNLIGNAVNALLDHPQELDRVVEDPGLVPALLEETLRFDAPVQLIFRTATEDVELAGTRIPRGAIVAPLIGSANRDERRFVDPDRFDVTRRPQGHLGFGFGKHFCLGSSLARLEARLTLEALVPELPRLRRAETERSWHESFVVRGPQRLALERAA